VNALAVNNAVVSFRPATLSVPAGAERELTVVFAPSQAGVQTATLRIGSNDRANAEVTVALRGAGASPAPPPPPPPAAEVRIEVTPPTLDFGSAPVGTAKDLPLTVRSTGNAPLIVSALDTNPPFTVVSPARPFTVKPGDSATVQIRFAPDRASLFAAMLTVRGNTATQPSLTVPMMGTGTAISGPRETVLSVDDGTFERMVGYPNWNAEAFWVNRFTPQYPAKLVRIQIYFPAEGDIAPNTQINLVLGTHPSATGTEDVIAPRMRPTPGWVREVGKWVDFDVDGKLDAIESGDFIVGFYVNVNGGLKPMALDVTRAEGKSYVSTDGSTYQKAEMAGLGGNFLIRAVVRVGQ
jgi:hypothetical protein